MTAPFKPDGFTSVSPYLIVAGASGSIEFLQRVFGAQVLRRFTDDNGRIRHAEVRIDDSVIMLADEVPPQWPAAPGHVHVYVADVDAAYQRALAAGARSVQEPAQRQDEDKRGGVRDASGTTWWIATRVARG